MTTRLVCVVTTIQPPTPCMHRLADAVAAADGRLIVVGDRKGPVHFDLPGARFVSLAEQERLPFQLTKLLPIGHYTRKNLGYLLALADQANCIYETDDDNMPGPGWRKRPLRVPVQIVSGKPWLNVYRIYTDEHIWPRGFPLERLADGAAVEHDEYATTLTISAPIQQGLADGAPDVDAVWRMTFGHEVKFRPGPNVLLPAGTWCPFNSQSTWWRPAAYPLLYLPSYCSFRMTDIWRSFVAQRCLWELGLGVVFHGPDAIQERNPHRLLRDFEDEVPGYLNNQKIADCLTALKLVPGEAAIGANLVRCYAALHAAGIFPATELPLVEAWVNDVRALQQGHGTRAEAA